MRTEVQIGTKNTIAIEINWESKRLSTKCYILEFKYLIES